MSNYHVNYRENPIEPPEPETPHGEENDKPEAGDIVAASPVLRRLDNFWYHYKWTVIVVAFFVTVGVVMLVQMINKPRYDTSVAFGSPYLMTNEERASFENLLNTVCPEDFDGNGEKSVNLVVYHIYSKEEIESEEEAFAAMTDENGETDNFQINIKFNQDEYSNFQHFVMTGETSVCFLSPYLYDSLLQGGRLKPLSEIYTEGTLPAGARADGCGIDLRETDFYTYHPAAQVMPENTILCVLIPPITGRVSEEGEFENDLAFFRAVADYRVKE